MIPQPVLEHWLSSWLLCSQCSWLLMERQQKMAVLGSMLQPGSHPSITAIWTVNQEMEEFFLSFILFATENMWIQRLFNTFLKITISYIPVSVHLIMKLCMFRALGIFLVPFLSGLTWSSSIAWDFFLLFTLQFLRFGNFPDTLFSLML